MGISDQTKIAIRKLTYPVIFERNPMDGIDRVYDTVVRRKDGIDGSKEFLAQIRLALASPESLAALASSNHEDHEIREFLKALVERIEQPRSVS